MSWTPPSRANMVGAWPIETFEDSSGRRHRRSDRLAGLPLYLIAVTVLDQLEQLGRAVLRVLERRARRRRQPPDFTRRSPGDHPGITADGARPGPTPGPRRR